MVMKKKMMKRKMHEEHEMKLDCECGLNHSIIHKVIKEKKEAMKLRGRFITGNEMKGTGCNLIEAHTDIEPDSNCRGLCVEYNE